VRCVAWLENISDVPNREGRVHRKILKRAWHASETLDWMKSDFEAVGNCWRRVAFLRYFSRLFLFVCVRKVILMVQCTLFGLWPANQLTQSIEFPRRQSRKNPTRDLNGRLRSTCNPIAAAPGLSLLSASNSDCGREVVGEPLVLVKGVVKLTNTYHNGGQGENHERPN